MPTNVSSMSRMHEKKELIQKFQASILWNCLALLPLGSKIKIDPLEDGERLTLTVLGYFLSNQGDDYNIIGMSPEGNFCTFGGVSDLAMTDRLIIEHLRDDPHPPCTIKAKEKGCTCLQTSYQSIRVYFKCPLHGHLAHAGAKGQTKG